MFYWQKEADKYIPQSLPGYDFVQCIPIYIPFKEIGLTVWERRTQSLTFIFECVMTSINAGTRCLSDLAKNFGVSESVMMQIVAQLDSENLLAVSAGEIILTGKGQTTLSALQKTLTQRCQFNQIFINQITGELSDIRPLGAYAEPPMKQVYLDEVYSIDLSFLRTQFDKLAQIYHDNQVSHIVFGQPVPIEVELYRILDISYEKLMYKQELCFVYLNQQDHSLAFKFKSGISAYENAIQDQLNKEGLGAGRLFAMPRMSPPPTELTFPRCSPDELIAAFNYHGDRQERQAAIENAYFKTRSLLSGEIEDILLHCGDFKPEAIYLSLPIMDAFITDSIIPCLIGKNTKSLVVCFREDDRSAEYIISKIKMLLVKRKDIKLNCHPTAMPSVIEILFGGACAIQGTYSKLDTVYHRPLHRLNGQITFDSEQIKHLWTTSDNDIALSLYPDLTNQVVEQNGEGKDRTSCEE